MFTTHPGEDMKYVIVSEADGVALANNYVKNRAGMSVKAI
jgi:hypothetical protein